MSVNLQAQLSGFVEDISNISTLTLQPGTIPDPGHGEVLAKILLAPINPSDIHQLLGRRCIGATTFPQVPGTEGDDDCQHEHQRLGLLGLVPDALQ